MLSTVWSRPPIWLVLFVALVTVSACGARSSQSGTSATIGVVTDNPNGLRNVQGFKDEMAQLGYLEADNVTYLDAGEPQTGADLERELESFVAAGVDLVFTAGTPTGVAAHRIMDGADIPVVFGVIADPVAAGVMEDLSHPGGNMTGVKLGRNQERRLELLLEIAPGTERVLVPYNPDDAAASNAVDQISLVAGALGVQLVLAEARTDAEVSKMLESVPEAIDAVFLVPDGTVNARLGDILNLATVLALPTSGPSTAQVEEGALTTYGFVHEEAGAQAARMADLVLRGADPGDLPVEDSESFMAINLVTAEEIGLEVTDAVLQQAEIIFRAGGAEEDGE
jgi:putative ABC transport system substrate-binding protein